MENLQNTSENKGCDAPASRVHHWASPLLIEALQGLVKRYGAGIVTMVDNDSLYRLIETHTSEKDKVENNYFWCREVLKEFQLRFAENRISWPVKE